MKSGIREFILAQLVRKLVITLTNEYYSIL